MGFKPLIVGQVLSYLTLTSVHSENMFVRIGDRKWEALPAFPIRGGLLLADTSHNCRSVP